MITNEDLPENIREIITSRPLTKEDILEHNIGPEHFMSAYDLPKGTILTESQLQEIIKKPGIVMQSAAFAGVANTPSENAHTIAFLARNNRPTKDGVVYTPEAELNMRTLAALYRHHGHQVTILPPTPGLIDQHYSTDSNKNFQFAKKAGKNEEGEQLWELTKPLALSPNFTHESRQGEAVHKRRYLKTTSRNPNQDAQRTLIQMENKMEFGDTRIALLPHPKTGKPFILAGLAATETINIDGRDKEVIGRSTKEGHEEFQRHINQHIDPNIEVVTVELKQPFYHMDTTGVVTQDGHFFTCKEAYSEKSWEDLTKLFGNKLVEVPLEDIDKGFGGNATSFGNEIYISDKVSMETAELMASKGFNVNMTPIPWTIASGGGHRCMTSVNHIAPEDGISVKIDNNRQGAIRIAEIDYGTEEIILKEYDRESKGWRQIADLTNTVSEYKNLYKQEMDSHGFSR